MSDYSGTGGAVLGAATILPLTAGVGMLFTNRANNLVVVAFLVLSLLNLVVTTAAVSRYMVNRRRENT